MPQFPVTPRTQVKRGSKRASYDKESIYAIIDEALVCHLACASSSGCAIQPTIHWREGDKLYVHGSSKNGLFQVLQAGAEACIAITLLDGLVFARSAFHHSVNYRSVIVYGRGLLISEDSEKRRQLDLMLEKVKPGRSQEARPANETELKATAVLEFDLNEISAKIRTGGPVDDPEDMQLDVWAGVEPITLVKGALIPDYGDDTP